MDDAKCRWSHAGFHPVSWDQAAKDPAACCQDGVDVGGRCGSALRIGFDLCRFITLATSARYKSPASTEREPSIIPTFRLRTPSVRVTESMVGRGGLEPEHLIDLWLAMLLAASRRPRPTSAVIGSQRCASESGRPRWRGVLCGLGNTAARFTGPLLS